MDDTKYIIIISSSYETSYIHSQCTIKTNAPKITNRQYRYAHILEIFINRMQLYSVIGCFVCYCMGHKIPECHSQNMLKVKPTTYMRSCQIHKRSLHDRHKGSRPLWRRTRLREVISQYTYQYANSLYLHTLHANEWCGHKNIEDVRDSVARRLHRSKADLWKYQKWNGHTIQFT